ncbi:MAG: amidohydrolase family protein, partial [Gammaproteobacteria bacterium]
TSPNLDLGNAAILPGFVNAHTHLDLSGLRGRCPPSDAAQFTDWLRSVIRHRRTKTPEQIEADIRSGLADSIAYGTTLLGDIAAYGASWPVLVDSPVHSVVFHEVLGLPRSRAEETARSAAAWLNDHPARGNCRPGISPHAPYSVHSSLFQVCAELASRHGLPLATHLAETREEIELLNKHSGPFVELLREVGVWEEDGLVDGAADVVRLIKAAPKILLIHGNYLPLNTPLPPQASLVVCPRTHFAFGHVPHPLAQWLAKGVNVALGTDSLASNPDLDVLAEARFLFAREPRVGGATLLRMATLNGAIALGWDDETGSLTPGKSADLVVLPLPNRTTHGPFELVLESSERVKAVMCRGRWIHGAVN